MNSVSLYIHIPFCKMKCHYCDFPSFSGKEQLMVDYAKALSQEISSSCKGKEISSIFIGGGTPTYLCIEGWKILQETIKKLSFRKENFEFTIEGNPKTFKEEQLEIFEAMGVNRISMGLQAVQDCHLESLGRVHTFEDFYNSFQMLRKAGFSNINVDLMFGLPGQSLKDWKETLQKVTAIGPEHISAYSLIIEEGTRFYKLYEEGKLLLPEEEVERAMYEEAIVYLEKAGYYQYEISNFAKKGYECKHNLVYWSLENYIGCGSSAHSYIHGTRYRNEEKVETYIRYINERGNAKIEEIINDKKDNMEEFMFLGLRKKTGISIKEFEERFEEPIHKIYGEVIEKHIKLKLLNEENNRLFLTDRGIELSNQVMSDFII